MDFAVRYNLRNKITMIQQKFVYNAKKILESEDNVIGLAVADSWLTDEMDELS